MTNRFFISDTHFGHANMLVFTNFDGSQLRTFDSVEAMDEHMIDRWNAVVKDEDTVYHCGDVVIAKRHLQTISRLKGKKRLIRGNHDIFTTKQYIEAGFKEIRGVHVMDDFILSHIPLHPDCITKRFKANVHGHLHGNRVRMPRGVDVRTGEILFSDKVDSRYFSVCVEQIDYTPMEYADVLENIRRQQ